MARDIDVPKGLIIRGDLPAIAPDQIVVDPAENTRMFKFDTSSLEESMLKDGQKQPCVVRPLPDKRVKLVAGFRRWTAAMNICERQKAEGVAPEDRFKLKVEVQKMSPEQAMDVNIIENHERQGLSPIETAHAIHRYRTQRGWIGDEGTLKIAQMFRARRRDGSLDTKWVERTEELVNLPEAEQYLVHQFYVTEGREGINVDAAKILSLMNKDDKQKVLEAAAEAKDIRGVEPSGRTEEEKAAKSASKTTKAGSKSEPSPTPPRIRNPRLPLRSRRSKRASTQRP